VALDGVLLVGPQELEQLGSELGRERRAHADAVQLTVVVVEPEQHRAHAVAALVHPVAGDHAVGRALVLDLELHALVGLVDPLGILGDHPVEAGALEADEPVTGQVAVGREWGQVDRRLRPGQG
jgi:hypothetical protein